MHAPFRFALLAAVAGLTGCSRAQETAQDAPASLLVKPALNLIVAQEVTSESAYERLYIHPTDGGGGDSGVTTGIGYDYSAVSQARAFADWVKLAEEDDVRLAATAGLAGPAARARLPGLQDISVPWEIAIDEFQVVDVPRYWEECEEAFPGFDDLRPNAQGAVLSVAYNRGVSMVGASRVDLRTLRTAIAEQDYGAMAAAVRHMLVTMRSAWQQAGIYQGMVKRRNAEAQLILTP